MRPLPNIIDFLCVTRRPPRVHGLCENAPVFDLQLSDSLATLFSGLFGARYLTHAKASHTEYTHVACGPSSPADVGQANSGCVPNTTAATSRCGADASRQLPKVLLHLSGRPLVRSKEPNLQVGE